MRRAPAAQQGSARRVLIVCPPGDEHALAVALRLAELGVEAVPLDLSALATAGFAATLGAGKRVRFEIGAHESTVDPARCLAVWWRRPRPVEPGDVPPDLRRLAEGEWAAAVAGFARTAGGAWVNDPAAEENAARKLVQLEAAGEVGLPVPRTLVTNDLARARAFIAGCGGGAVVKSLSSLREGGYTRRVTAGDEALEARLRAGPAIFQERVEGLDVRAVAVGDRLFAMSLDACAGGDADDVRRDWDRVRVTARPVELPPSLAAALLALQRRLGLLFGAIDLRRRADGAWAFLEVNASGQWLHVEAETGHPIAAALARLLACGGGRASRSSGG